MKSLYLECEPPHPELTVARPRDEVASPLDEGKVPDLRGVSGEGGEAVLDGNSIGEILLQFWLEQLIEFFVLHFHKRTEIQD